MHMKVANETLMDAPMKKFYLDKTIFITGGTGFLGQLFIEKLLRCKVREIYVLARPKKNKSPAERIQETFIGELYAKLNVVDPDYMKKIKIIEGDTCKADLGISADDRKDMIENVEIVIHAAADVRFDKPLQELCFTNVRGTKALTALAEEMKNLVVFAYISTAFSQYYRDKLEEKFYPPPLDPDQMIRIAEHFDGNGLEELNSLTDKLLQPWENTYVFTKSLSEEVVRRTVHKFRTVLIRPSIVISTYEDPIPAWSNNLYGVNGMVVGAGLGFIRICFGDPNRKNSNICADFVMNGTLAAIWDKANEKNKLTALSESKVVYNITPDDPTTNGRYTEEMSKLFLKFPTKSSMWIPSVTYCKTKIMFYILTIFYQAIPSITLDAVLKLTNKNSRILPIYRKSQEFLQKIAYFVDGNWCFINNNLKGTLAKMSTEDKTFFPCDVSKFNMVDFCYPYMLGLRTYVLKEPINNQYYVDAEKKLLLLRTARYVVLTLYYSLLVYFVYFCLNSWGYNKYLKIICPI